MTDKKVAFVTGANRGLGFETSRELAEKGITVIMDRCPAIEYPRVMQ